MDRYLRWARGRILVNRGHGTILDEIRDAEDHDARLPTRALGTDRPGRAHDSSGAGRHAMAPPVDWHKFEKERFAKEIAAMVNTAVLENKFDRVVLVASPRALSTQAKANVSGEIGKDPTQVAVHDLAPHLSDHINL